MIQQQRMIEMEQQAAATREMALRERREMLVQRRREREAALAAEAAQRQQMAEQIQQSRQQPPAEVEVVDIDDSPVAEFQASTGEAYVNMPEPVIQTEEPIMGDSNEGATPSEGYVKLADYLNGALNDGKNAKSIVGELKMALMMNMFSRDVLNEVISEDFDTLVDTVGGIHPRLKSPKARLILKDVVKGMK